MDLPIGVLIQAIINGIALGWLYVLMALGLAFILSMMSILQLAHGEIYMIGAYLTYYFAVFLGLTLFPAIVLSMTVMAFFGLFLQRFLFRRVQGQMLQPIMISVGLMLILTSAAVAGFGLYERSIPRLAVGSFTILGSAVPKDRIFVVVISINLLLLVYLFLKKTKYGQAMVACSQNREYALLRGIDTDQMSRFAFIIASALAAAAGALAGSILMLSPFMGTPPLVKGLVIIVLGGMGSILGAAIGGIVLGIFDGVFPVIFGPAVAAVAPLILVIIILLIRPQGVFGHDENRN